MFPDDDQFEEHILTSVEKHDSGWSIHYGAIGFGVPAESPVVPEVGMTARFYGRGFGSRVRGLFLNGEKVFYRTEAEDKEHSEIELYGSDAADWLKRWDEGRSVWTIEMGGLGPGYEQCIHVTCAEILRHMLAKQYEREKLKGDEWKRVRQEIEDASFQNETIKALGLSGVQWGAALNVATMLYIHGPRHIMSDERVKDRHIQVQRTFPAAA